MISQTQLDHRWIERYRELVAYDTYWWWAQAGPFVEGEQEQWDRLIEQDTETIVKEKLNRLIVDTRNRELATALEEHREPRLWYPVLKYHINDVRTRITAQQQLDSEILREEPNGIVRSLYHDTITEEIDFLHLMETAYTGDSDRYWELSRLLNTKPTRSEMEYALNELKSNVLEGLRYRETCDHSLALIQLIREQLHLSDLVTDAEITHAQQGVMPLSFEKAKQTVSAQAVKYCFEQILQESGYTAWTVDIDPKAGGASVDPALRQLSLPDMPFTLERVRHLLSHEIAGHIVRSAAGEQSPIGLLGLGTAGYMTTEEGFALYNEYRTASLHGEPFDSSGGWINMLAVGLACGVVTPPQKFTALFAFFEPFLLINRLIKGLDKDLETAKNQAHKRAISRCLRTYRGVPSLECTGICYSKDVVYQRGVRLIEQAVAQDDTVLDRLAVGKIALERLHDLHGLNLTTPSQPLRERAFDPGLDAYILSFEQMLSKDKQERKK
jgi:hypothetical protein